MCGTFSEAMSEIQVIETALQRAAGRRRWARGLRGLWVGLLVGAVLSLLMIGAWHVFPLPMWTLTVAALVPFPCLLAGFIIGASHQQKLTDVARWVDGKQHLQERLSTALEVSSTGVTGNWRDLVVTDAADHLKGMDVRRLVPFRLTKAARWAMIVLVVGAGLGFVPEYRSKAYLQKEADKQNIKEVGKQLAELTRHDLEKRAPALQPTEKAMESVKELGDQLAKKTLTRSEALKDLANMAEKLKDELKDMNTKDPGLKRMQEAARAASGNDSQSPANLQKQIDSLQKQLGTPAGTPDALDKMKSDLQKLQQAAKAMAQNNSGASDAEKQKLSDAMSALSQQMQSMGMQLPQLDEAIKALEQNNPDLVMKDLEASLTDLEKMRDMAKSLQQMQQQMEKMGKDLGDQLKNGQPEMAQATLQKMMQQLQKSNLSQQDLQKMMEEVKKAIDPANNYENVAQPLKDAVAQMKEGNKDGAGKSLAQASKALSELMDQMGDAQALMASLDNLNKASMCVGTCQGWGKCNKPGFNPNGNRPGSGVGTWSDSSAQWDGQFNDHWDNSGVVRPDEAARGQTDRGDGALNSALTPTKVKGQFSQGGPMPSITLKGVSIKGQSKVEYEEASAAAQSEAQSALSQEKVPRAYQGAVREYFDDIKK